VLLELCQLSQCRQSTFCLQMCWRAAGVVVFGFSHAAAVPGQLALMQGRRCWWGFLADPCMPGHV
jgi:hypothetical protein